MQAALRRETPDRIPIDFGGTECSTLTTVAHRRLCDYLGLPAVHRAQAGLIADMDYVADVLYSRVKKEAEQAVLA